MLPEGTTIRRATLDDLESLRGLWMECRLPEYDLERRFTEFQVVIDPQGWILAAVGLRFAETQGEVHSLGIRRPDLEQAIGDLLWDKILALADQHGAHRLWTRDHGPFWDRQGFVAPEPAVRRTLPQSFGPPNEAWHVRKLREEPLKLIAAEEQLEAFLELERMKTDNMVRRVRVLKLLAVVFAAGLFVLALGALMILLRRSPERPRETGP